MPDETNSSVAEGVKNLKQIKNGDDPRSERTRVEKVQDEIDRLFAEHEMPDSLSRRDINGYVAGWEGKIGNCKYETYIASKEYGKRVTGTESRPGNYAIGIAKRAFDSRDTWLDTVAHELAHVTAYIKNGRTSARHNALWETEAERLGADPSRTSLIGFENRVPYKYYLGCPSGCFRNGKMKRSKRIQYPHRYGCPECGDTCVSWEREEPRPTDGGTCAVDVSDL